MRLWDVATGEAVIEPGSAADAGILSLAAGDLDLNGVIEALRREKFATVLGEIAFDAKGDVTTTSFVWYRWTDGKYVAVK